MKRIIGICFPLVFLLVGCEQEDRPRGEDLREGAGEAVRAPGDYISTNIRAQQQAEVQMATQSVTQAVRHFQAAEGRNPRNLEELVSEDYLPQIPDLPRGGSFKYNPQTGQVTVEGY